MYEVFWRIFVANTVAHVHRQAGHEIRPSTACVSQFSWRTFNRGCCSACYTLSAVSYDPLSHSRHNAGDRSTKVVARINLYKLWTTLLWHTTSTYTDSGVTCYLQTLRITSTSTPVKNLCLVSRTASSWLLNALVQSRDFLTSSRSPHVVTSFPLTDTRLPAHAPMTKYILAMQSSHKCSLKFQQYMARKQAW